MNEKQFISVIPYSSCGDLLSDARTIIDGARQYAYSAVNVALVQRNWLLGKRISEEILKGDNRAEYGAEVIVRLAKELKAEYGDGFTKTNLYNFTEFYKAFPEIFHAAGGKFDIRLSWTHLGVKATSVQGVTRARLFQMHQAGTKSGPSQGLSRQNVAKN